MRISAERLAAAAEATGFRADMLERVAQLIGLLAAIQRHPFLRGKLALKGGTALNLFVFDVPRLSVDIDLNYVGAESREAMLAERPRLEEALDAVFRREDLSSRQTTNEHADSSWTLRYPTASGQTGRVDVDINYMSRRRSLRSPARPAPVARRSCDRRAARRSACPRSLDRLIGPRKAPEEPENGPKMAPPQRVE